MKYGHFDNENREYVIDRPDVPVSWTNYLGVEDFCTVISHNAGGYSFYRSPQYHRITRFRQNGVPLDRPGHYVYLRDDETGEYWSLSWQPTGKDKDCYETRHGLSYSVFKCGFGGIEASQTLFVPLGDACELWDVALKNASGKPRKLSVFGYCEFSFHHIDMDNQNFQMSLYAAGADYKDGIIQHDLYYEETGFQSFAATFRPDGFDCTRDAFLGSYRTETNPIALERGDCSGSSGTTGNHCGALMKRIELAPGESADLLFLLCEGGREQAARLRAKYADKSAVQGARRALADWWEKRLGSLRLSLPHPEMENMLNVWTLYQAEVNVLFSRFASFIEVGGRTGLGYRDTAQDAMCISNAEPDGCRKRLLQLLHGQTSAGYGLHLFQPEWFMKNDDGQSFKSPTVVPMPDKSQMIHGIKDVCSDDHLWLVASVCEYVRETGDVSFFDRVIPYADSGEASVYEHIARALDFTHEHMGAHGIPLGLRADWNDCLNLGGGESAMVAFLYLWALKHFVDAARFLGRTADAEKYEQRRQKAAETAERSLWDGKWFLRGFTSSGRPIGSSEAAEGKVHLESNTWAVVSGAVSTEKALDCMDAVDEYLYTPYGLMLNAPSFTVPDDEVGFVTRVYPGVKENGAVFSHPNPWAWAAECMLGRGDRAVKLYDALCPALQNDIIEIRKAEPYSYCQFVMGSDHALHGQANHPWMTGTAGWAYYAATRFILGIRPEFDRLTVDPCIPPDWKSFSAVRVWRGTQYRITVENPGGVQRGVGEIYVNGRKADFIPVSKEPVEVRVVMSAAKA
ncbi:MAG: N,N'-diacetylchitobiose phosphorylase [Oscillospiraceae bacterium]|jgi:N,N'-diacetylchitobiose phosphorylase|nr:N,N'-diacetylchitobiose phosphorylase [Oscillospiraceae bacterium]